MRASHGGPGRLDVDQAAPAAPSESSLRSGLRRLFAGHPEAAAFWIAALVYVVPVWAFPYLPTQDGPAHLYNAQILKDIGDAATGYDEFFELRAEPLPNLTSHLLLAALLFVVPPLVAEKLLVSVYVLGFAGSFRWFLGAFGPRCRPLAWAGLLLVYNRCLWMGFYNYCLSLILLWLILGYCLRRRGRIHVPQMFLLTLLFAGAFFTHLVGFLLAAVGALGAAVVAPPRRVLDTVLIGVAVLPSACLTMSYFEQTGFFRAPPARRLYQEPLARLRGQSSERSIWRELRAIDNELGDNHLGHAIPGSLILVVYLGLLAAVTVYDCYNGRTEERDGPGRLFPAVFGLLLLAGYLLVPSHLDFSHGGFLKTRLAPLPLLVWLACLREPAQPRTRFLARMAVFLLLAANLVLVTWTIRDGNRELQQYTAGMEAAGRGHRLFVMQADPSPAPLVNPLLHAADYYCLGTGNVNLDNYEASTLHFPVKYRAGVNRGRGTLAAYSRKDAVDLVLCWQIALGGGALEGWDEVFRQERLRLYRRPAPP
jgi:hypothetical protein